MASPSLLQRPDFCHVAFSSGLAGSGFSRHLGYLNLSLPLLTWKTRGWYDSATAGLLGKRSLLLTLSTRAASLMCLTPRIDNLPVYF